MKYRLHHKVFGRKEPELIVEFDIPYLIKAVTYCKEEGFVFLAGSAIGKILDGEIEFPFIGDPNVNNYSPGMTPKFFFPNSICEGTQHSIYMSLQGGKKIWAINLKDKYAKELVTGSWSKNYLNLFANVKEEGHSSICAKKDYVYWLAKDINRCFVLKDNFLSVVAGNGRAGYSVSSKTEDVMLNAPSSICCDDDYVIVADQGNKCIRKIDSRGVSLIAGHPVNDKINPRQVLTQNKFLYFLEENTIKLVNPKVPDKYTTFYESDRIISMLQGEARGIYIMEMINATT